MNYVSDFNIFLGLLLCSVIPTEFSLLLPAYHISFCLFQFLVIVIIIIILLFCCLVVQLGQLNGTQLEIKYQKKTQMQCSTVSVMLLSRPNQLKLQPLKLVMGPVQFCSRVSLS